VVEEACEKLGYVLSRGRFARVEDLLEQQNASYVEQICRKYGIDKNPSAVKTTEDLNLVRGAIKELFPRIPEADLEQIVHHAWEAGTDRVGTAKDLSLARRVQLAVIARIRHTYTDYDILLRAFDWRTAREQVEPVSLRKLIEWRGENDGGEDNELEEMVRETIVIDDDGEDDHANELNDLTDSFDDVTSDDSGSRSRYDTISAERNGHRARQPMPARGVLHKDSVAQATDVARTKIAQARQWMRQPPTHDPSRPVNAPHYAYPALVNPGNVPPPSVYAQPPDAYNHAAPPDNPGYINASPHTPDTIVVDGRIMRKVRLNRHRPGNFRLPFPQVIVAPHGNQVPPHVYDPTNGTSYAGQQAIRMPIDALRHTPPTRYVGHDQAIPSIEHDASPRYEAPSHATQLRPMRRSGPNTPDSFGAFKRKRLDEHSERASPAYRPMHRDFIPRCEVEATHDQCFQEASYGSGQQWQPSYQSATAQPKEVRVVRVNAAYQSAPGSPRQEHTNFPLPGYRPQQHLQQLPDAYNPAHPKLVDERHVTERRTSQEHPYPARLETRPTDMQYTLPDRGAHHHSQPQHTTWNGHPFVYQQPQGDVRYVSAAQQPRHPRPLPAPVHGAPAPVQTMPKETRYDSRFSGSHGPLRYAASEQAGMNGVAYPPPEPAYGNNNWAPPAGSTYQSNGATPTQYYPR